MATTVNDAFAEFMNDSVNLNPTQTNIARSSRDNLIGNINTLSENNKLFKNYKERNLKYGSFARNTKKRPLDDIDLMMCISGDGRTYLETEDCILIYGNDADKSNDLLTGNTTNLNSKKVINQFKGDLANLNDYKNAELHRNQEAVTLQLKSYSWNFDIVPCFYTENDFYVIPDGNGNWKKTDPRMDNDRTTLINQNQNGNLLSLIRLMKYWNARKVTITIPSYLLECMILDIYDEKESPEVWWIDIQFSDLLYALSIKILENVYEPTKFQGNINNFSYDDRVKISEALITAYNKTYEAREFEGSKDQKQAMQKWREILGENFPGYTGE